MVDTSKMCKYHIVLVCAICCIKRHYITKISIILSTCSISLKYVDQLSMLIHNKVIEEGIICFFLPLHLCHKQLIICILYFLHKSSIVILDIPLHASNIVKSIAYLQKSICLRGTNTYFVACE
jgi:hypothetical protein